MLSLVGWQVLCSTNTSFPRTFSFSSTVISPSENLLTAALPSIARYSRSATLRPSAGLALPVNTIIFDDMRFTSRGLKMAGAGGFEPPNGGIKTRCLATWRRPNINGSM